MTYDAQALSDCQEIRDLTTQYNYSVDTGDAQGYARLFVEDGEYVVVGHHTYRGRAELAALIAVADQASSIKPVHVTTDSFIEIDGDSARQRARLLTCMRTEDGSVNELVNTGWFFDELIRTSKGWRFVRRTAQVDLSIAATLSKLGIAEALAANTQRGTQPVF